MSKVLVNFAAMFSVLYAPGFAIAHPGGLDASGGHHDRRSGGYHYHNRSVAPATAQPAPILMATPRLTPRDQYRSEPRTVARYEDRRAELSKQYAIIATPPILNTVSKVSEEEQKRIDDAKWRIWTTADGGYRTEAKFVMYGNGIVTLMKRDEKQVKVEMDLLCFDDQEFIRKRKWLHPLPGP